MHNCKSTNIEWHKDGSATIHHIFEVPADDVKHAATDMDAVHDSIEEHIGESNHEENSDESGKAYED